MHNCQELIKSDIYKKINPCV